MANKLLPLGALLPFLAVCAFAQTATTDPVGFIRKECQLGYTGFATPLVSDPVFTGRISSNSSANATLEGGNLRLGDSISGAGPLYVEVISGPFEGERIDIDEAATITANGAAVTFDTGSVLNTTAPTPNSLVGATCVIRKHCTLAKLQAMFSPALTGNNNPNSADRVYLFENGSWIRYYLLKDNTTWLTAGNSKPQSDKVIPPGTGILVELKSSAKTALQLGAVRMNAFRINLTAGTQCIAPAFPVSLTPTQVGAFVDINEPATYRWTGNNNPAKSDTISPFITGSFIRYNLAKNGTTWLTSGSAEDYSDDAIIDYSAPALLKRNNPNPEYIILRPYNP